MAKLRLGGGLLLSACLVPGLMNCGGSSRPADMFAVSAPAPEVATTNLVDYCVVQRDANHEGTLKHVEPCELNGKVYARVLAQNQPVPGLDWQVVGTADSGLCTATISHVPVGGPYRVELEVRTPSGQPLLARDADEILVGDLWALPGQSNMLGWGDLVGAEQPSPAVHSYGLNEQWAIAEEPLHWVNESPDGAHHPGKSLAQIETARRAPRAGRARGAGLGLPFAKELYRRTGVPVGLIPCAHGGTSMDQWSPDKRALGPACLYGSMLRRIRAAGGHIRGVLWYQGEDDAHPNTQQAYGRKFEHFIATLRQDLNDPQLPFYYVQIGRTTGYPRMDEAWSAIREQQRQTASKLPSLRMVPAIDLELDDHIHIGTHGLARLGRRLALIAQHDLFGNLTLKPGPALRSVAFADPARMVIRVTFGDVNGRLKPDEHIGGFSLSLPDGRPAPDFFDVRVDRNDPSSVLCRLESPPPAGCQLWYGYGRNPYCNLVDEADMAAPAFGPIPLPNDRTR